MAWRVTLGLLFFTGSLTPAAPLTHMTIQAEPHLAPISQPLYFEPNRGQAPPGVRFIARTRGYTLFLNESGAVVANGLHTAPLVIYLMGSHQTPHLVGTDRMSGRVNYFLGGDPRRWYTDIPVYGEVVYRDVYRGIDLIFHGKADSLEYDWVVHPGALIQSIRVEISSAGSAKTLHRDRQGDVSLVSRGFTFLQSRPKAYQLIRGVRKPVQIRTVLFGGGMLGFASGPYVKNSSLIIDPILHYSTYLGGSGDDFGAGIATDATGNAYITGGTTSINFPTAHAWQPKSRGREAFVTKLDGKGRLVYSTYLGGSGSQYANSIAVDGQGSVSLAGYNDSADFPAPGGHIDNPEPCPEAFMAQLSYSGKLVFSQGMQLSTDVGGSCYTEAVGVALDGHGTIYVAGNTSSSQHGSAFVTKMGNKGYTSLLPGATAAGLAVDGTGYAYVTGSASRSLIPVKALQPVYGGGLEDAFVAKLDATGKTVHSTFLGGGGDDAGRGIAVDASGNAYVTGDTSSIDFPQVGGLRMRHTGGACRPGEVLTQCTDAFVTKLDPSGQKLVYSTYLGGSDNDAGFGIAVDRARNAYITGSTSSSDFPVIKAPQRTFGGGKCAFSTVNPFPCSDAFISKLNAAGDALRFSTYLGGANEDAGMSIAVHAGNAYVTGFTRSRHFPTVSAFQRRYGGGTNDAFVVELAKK